jgi:RNA polymerase sigma-70 factor (ECF subfamily)
VSSEEFDEPTLCRRAAGGDADALSRLLYAQHAALLGFARRKIGPEWRGKIEPEDLLQEAFVQVFTHVAGFSYSGEGSFYRWAARIISNLYVDHARRWRAGKREASRERRPGADRSTSYANLLTRCLPADEDTPSKHVQFEDAVSFLMHCIARLPEEHRVAVQRLYLRDEPLSDVAAALSRSEDATRRLAGRAIERLRRCLGRASRYFSRPPG